MAWPAGSWCLVQRPARHCMGPQSCCADSVWELQHRYTHGAGTRREWMDGDSLHTRDPEWARPPHLRSPCLHPSLNIEGLGSVYCKLLAVGQEETSDSPASGSQSSIVTRSLRQGGAAPPCHAHCHVNATHVTPLLHKCSRGCILCSCTGGYRRAAICCRRPSAICHLDVAVGATWLLLN
jgi:hypothetical protein